MKILISEEYGYHYYIWDFPGTKEELTAIWDSGNFPVTFWGPTKPVPQGVLIAFDPGDCETLAEYDAWKKLQRECEVYVHVHTEEDTYMDLNNRDRYKDED